MPSSFHDRYPARYEDRLMLKNGKSVFIRPLRDTDEPLILDLFGKLGHDSIYQRFLSCLKSLPEDLLFRLTHINYDSQFALVASIDDSGRDSVIAVARYCGNPGSGIADFAIVVRDDWQHIGLGKTLLLKIFAIGREHGISRFVSIIDPGNRVMKQMLRRLDCPVKYSYVKGCIQAEISV